MVHLEGDVLCAAFMQPCWCARRALVHSTVHAVLGAAPIWRSLRSSTTVQ